MIYRIFYIGSIVAILGFSACLGVLFYAAEQPWVDFSVLEHYNPGKPSILLDDEGNEWARFEFDKREVRKYHHIPVCVRQAFIAVEDWKFFSHNGLSYKGIIRSFLKNIIKGKRAEGASTITQQLVRLLFFEKQKSFTRKIKEQILALIVERQFTKEQILETYLNHIYLGAGIYGVEAACQRFWGKSVTECTIDEAAVLAAIVRYPRKYCPLYCTESSRKRRNLILSNMVKLGFITKKEYITARDKPVTVIEHKNNKLGSHMKETMRLFLEKRFGKKRLYTGGLVIQTTINSEMQQAAERVFKHQMSLLHNQYSDDLEGALICIEGSTGAIKALVGGCNFSTSQFNRALQASRQVGSTFKTLVFAHALTKGASFTDIDIDEPFTLKQGNQEWSPQNANKKFLGPMTLSHALSRSNNIISIKTFINTGPEEIVALAEACNLKPTHAYPSLALGCVEATPLRTVAMINIFAQHGRYAEPYSIAWVKDEWGTRLYKKAPQRKHILPPHISDQVAKVLTLRIEEARKRFPQWFAPCDAFGKSGTTNDARTCWYVGATPRYTTAVYIGYDDNRTIGQWVLGSRTAFPIWRDFNQVINQPDEKFSYDSQLKQIIINSVTGDPCSEDHVYAAPILISKKRPINPHNNINDNPSSPA